MTVLTLAIIGSVVGTLSSIVALFWSAFRVRSQKGQHGDAVRISAKLSGGRSISIDVSSATPEEVVAFIAKVKEDADTRDGTGSSG